MSEALTVAEQVMVAAAVVVTTVSCDFAREERALDMVREVLPAVSIDATRSVYAVRVHCGSLANLAGAGDARAYDSARLRLRAALATYFEQRAAAACQRLGARA